MALNEWGKDQSVLGAIVILAIWRNRSMETPLVVILPKIFNQLLIDL